MLSNLSSNIKRLLFVSLYSVSLLQAQEAVLLSFKPKAGMVRADLYYIETVKAPQAVLVLAPGCNGNGKILVEHPTWQEFAKKMNIGLVGLSFASNLQDLHNGKGYYYASNGSGGYPPCRNK